jgi:hypothetical protein
VVSDEASRAPADVIVVIEAQGSTNGVRRIGRFEGHGDRCAHETSISDRSTFQT